jgi:predicted transcriptional regulator
MERLYPELKEEIAKIRDYKPTAIQFATRFEDKMIGNVVRYVGNEWKEYVKGQKVTIIETPLSIAVNGCVCFQTADGFIFTAPRIDLRF